VPKSKVSRAKKAFADSRLRNAVARPRAGKVGHRWRFWESQTGSMVIADEIAALGQEDALSVHAQMIIVRQDGLAAAEHLVEDIYEVEAHGVDHSYRLLFSSEGKKGRILLALHLLEKKTQKTPKRVIDLAKKRRDDWRSR
jgi:phage-related protein